MILIGISGTNGSGKDTVAHLLAEKYGFYFASTSEMLRDELKRRNLPLERENQRFVSAEWRREHGLGVLVDKGIEQARANGKQNIVVGSLRNSGEVERVHELGGTVIWIDSDPRVRYDRIRNAARGRVEDMKSFEQFIEEEKVEMKRSGDSATLNMGEVKAMSDRILLNESKSIDEFKAQAETALKDLLYS